MLWRKKADRSETTTAGAHQVLRCSFCNKLQDDVPKLIAGPKVFICDECVAICNDILADDARAEQRTGRKAQRRSDQRPALWPNAVQCALCRSSIAGDQGLVLDGNRGMLCPDCVSAVRAATASGH